MTPPSGSPIGLSAEEFRRELRTDAGALSRWLAEHRIDWTGVLSRHAPLFIYAHCEGPGVEFWRAWARHAHAECGPVTIAVAGRRAADRSDLQPLLERLWVQ